MSNYYVDENGVSLFYLKWKEIRAREAVKEIEEKRTNKLATMAFKLKDITTDNIRNFVQGTFLFWKKGNPDHINEQANYRANACPEKCIEAPSLKCCGCQVPEAFFSPKKKCTNGYWGPMLSKEAWEQFKIDNNI